MLKRIIALTLVFCFCLVAFSVPASAEERIGAFDYIMNLPGFYSYRMMPFSATADYLNYDSTYYLDYYSNIDFTFRDFLIDFKSSPNPFYNAEEIKAAYHNAGWDLNEENINSYLSAYEKYHKIYWEEEVFHDHTTNEMPLVYNQRM